MVNLYQISRFTVNRPITRPKMRDPSDVASTQWLPIRQIEIEIEIEIEIGIGIAPRPLWHPALMDRSNLAAELCQHRSNTVARPGSSCPNPIPHQFDTDTDTDPDPDLASPLNFGDSLWREKSCHRGHREHRGANPVLSESNAAEVRAASSMVKERNSL
jgi:hypothetical protein